MADGVFAIVDNIKLPAQCAFQCVGKAGNQAIAAPAKALLCAIDGDGSGEDHLARRDAVEHDRAARPGETDRLPEGRTMPATTAEFRAKTGTERDPAGNVTWWVGAVDGPRGRLVFVSRVRAPGEPSSRSPAVAEGAAALAAAGVL